MSNNLQLLQELAQKPAMVAWFTQHFLQMRLSFTDTGEKFTLINRDNHVEVVSGFQPAPPVPKDLFAWLGFDPSRWYSEDFIVPLQTENLRRLKEILADDILAAHEIHRIVSYLVQPLLRAGLTVRALHNPIMLALLNIHPFWQQALIDPAGNESQQLTVIFMYGQWLLIPGYYGRPKHRYLLTAEQLLAMQRRMKHAEQHGTLAAWLDATRWFWQWRAGLTVAC